MRRTLFLVLTVLMLGVVQVSAQTPDDVGFEQELFPPELVMRHQRDIGLADEQRRSITEAIKQLQATVVDLQWELQEQTRVLGELLRERSVDEASALEQVDGVLEVERRIKRAHMSLLIRIKNVLTPEQQARLNSLRGR